METLDYLIVGQGLAGSILAHQLIQKQKRIGVVDLDNGNTASRQATGLINPVTGRRFVKSWKIDELLPFAQTYYEKLNISLNDDFFRSSHILKILHNKEQLNDFHSRSNEDAYAPYLGAYQTFSAENIYPGVGQAKIAPVLQININSLLDALGRYIQDNAKVRQETFKHEDLFIRKGFFEYKDIKATKVVFAEGYLMRFNPFFNYLPIRFAKGEALIIESEDLKIHQVLSSKINISPMGKDTYYVGATYDWSSFEQSPTKAKKDYILEAFQESVRCTFKIIDHKVGIRPTVKDRRPLLGEHPKHRNMYVFNGMGTKGLSLSPFFAQHLIHHMEYNEALYDEVNINRFHEA